jgi:hypothetical protein
MAVTTMATERTKTSRSARGAGDENVVVKEVRNITCSHG